MQRFSSFSADGDRRYYVAQFIREFISDMVRNTDNSCNVLTRTAIDRIVRYLATA